MKELKCLDCDEKFKASSPEEMMKAMMPHYMESHKEMIEEQSEETKEEWMKRFHEGWEAAKEIEE